MKTEVSRFLCGACLYSGIGIADDLVRRVILGPDVESLMLMFLCRCRDDFNYVVLNDSRHIHELLII